MEKNPALLVSIFLLMRNLRFKMSTPEAEQKRTLDPAPSSLGYATAESHDAIFGEITEDGPNYRSVRIVVLVALFAF